jgi:hypothetical protein
METSEFFTASPYLVLISRPPLTESLAAILASVSCSNVFGSASVIAEVGGAAQKRRARAMADHGHSILCRFGSSIDLACAFASGTGCEWIMLIDRPPSFNVHEYGFCSARTARAKDTLAG